MSDLTSTTDPNLRDQDKRTKTEKDAEAELRLQSVVARLFFLKQVFDGFAEHGRGSFLDEYGSEGLAEILEDMLGDTMESRDYYLDYIEAEGERARRVQS